tara:strand:- start:40 stop:1302 length:1263 start_codon:yes stop_codon:yes gene_type:complete
MDTISPLDNRYSNKIQDVAALFSDYRWNHYKYILELAYLYFFMEKTQNTTLSIKYHYNRDIYDKICEEEKKTNHDIQALINVIKTQVPPEHSRWVHFGLTSQDINSPSMIMVYKEFVNSIFLPDSYSFQEKMVEKIDNYGDIDILSFTHGQPATPIKIKNIFEVYISKLKNIRNDIFDYKWATKIGGSNGNLSSLYCVFPDIDWQEEIDSFVEKLGIERNKYTTQIDDYCQYFKLFQIFERLCFLLINICQDIWYYCSKKYFYLKNVENEVGSSAMPHKINPIQFENAEGNLKLAASIFHTIGTNIMLCRLQRDLTDSTLLRNVGVAFGHLMLSIRNMKAGIDRLEVNSTIIKEDLDNNNCIQMEVIQLLFRKWDIQDGYNICKEYIRGKTKFDTADFLAYLKNTKNINLNPEQIKFITP